MLDPLLDAEGGEEILRASACCRVPNGFDHEAGRQRMMPYTATVSASHGSTAA